MNPAEHTPRLEDNFLTRRDFLLRSGMGFGAMSLAGLLPTISEAAIGASTAPLLPKKPHFPAKAKHVIHLFMNGGPSQVDTFDPKPELTKRHGEKPGTAGLKTERRTGPLFKSPYKFVKCGQSGIEVSEIFPEIGEQIDDICVVRSVVTDVPNHEP